MRFNITGRYAKCAPCSKPLPGGSTRGAPLRALRVRITPVMSCALAPAVLSLRGPLLYAGAASLPPHPRLCAVVAAPPPPLVCLPPPAPCRLLRSGFSRCASSAAVLAASTPSAPVGLPKIKSTAKDKPAKCGGGSCCLLQIVAPCSPRQG